MIALILDCKTCTANQEYIRNSTQIQFNVSFQVEMWLIDEGCSFNAQDDNIRELVSKVAKLPAQV